MPTLQDGLGRDDLVEGGPRLPEALEAAARDDDPVEPCTVHSGDGQRLPWARLSGGPR
ncbi:hypothetical protein [Blastococcus brunescens]|uniref:Uncharacterized protein n=1 Tax=Blastococcus brunescens TaxID=1564165 RepID=A0ABZ1B0M7_9ACTN|nr:hypothetical protein [Blastococcus sp. BMG 8361]WRL64359.1 hypothetical protein U6N30_00365 [Blastococcus sp. BMG 8361]